VQARVLAAAAARIGVAVLAGEAFYPHDARGIMDGRERLRLSCASHPPEVIAEGVRRLRMLIQDPAMHRQSVVEHAAMPVV
jgi:DNA-binding transcriptional MocR family regulator